jgi:hypothetical protein
MTGSRGSSLIETLVASVILVSGVVALASIFSVTTGTSLRNQQRTMATMLVYDKMEQLPGSPAGGSLDPSNPSEGFVDYVRIGSDGTKTTSNIELTPAYLRLWEVQDSENPTITVVVFAGIGAATPLELARATGPR